MSATETMKEKIMDFVILLGGTGVVVGGIWGFYMALKLLFGAA